MVAVDGKLYRLPIVVCERQWMCLASPWRSTRLTEYFTTDRGSPSGCHLIAGKELSMHVCVAQAPAGKVNSAIQTTLSL